LNESYEKFGNIGEVELWHKLDYSEEVAVKTYKGEYQSIFVREIEALCALLRPSALSRKGFCLPRGDIK
jgi:hypothetical protein